MLRAAPPLVLALSTALLAGCGSSTRNRKPEPHRPTPPTPAQERRVAMERRQRIAAEASDLNPRTSCSAWLETSQPAQVKYVRRHWDRLPPKQALIAARQQSLSCRFAPPPGHRHPMGPLQPAVSLAVVGFEVFYEEALREGDHETVSHFYGRVVNALHW